MVAREDEKRTSVGETGEKPGKIGKKRLSDVQLAFLRALWDLGEGTVAEVKDQLDGLGRALAPTTVATVLGRLEKRGLVTHRTRGKRRQYIFRAAVTEREIQRSVLDRITDTLFHGDVTAIVSHLLRARDIEAGDLARVRALIESREEETET